MKRSVLLFLLSIIIACTVTAGEVTYFNRSWQEIRDKAKAEHKYIFIDCYTDWCGWCKTMDKETMTSADVISTLSDNFIAVKMDMENGEGIKLAMKYHVTGFPSFLFFSPDGTYIYQSAGYQKPGEFMKELKGVLDGTKQTKAPGFSREIDMNYPEFYKGAFAGNGKRTSPKQEDVTAYLAAQSDLLSEINWAVIARFGTDEKYTKFFLDNVNNYRRLYGEAGVNNKLNSVLGDMLTTATKNNDDKMFATLLLMVDKYVTEDPAASRIYCSISYYKGTKNWSKYAGAIDDYIEKKGLDNSSYINGLCWDLYEHCDDKKLLKKACGWMKAITQKEPTYPYLDTYASLLYKSGQMKEAEAAAGSAIATGKKNGTDVKSTEELLQKIKGKKS